MSTTKTIQSALISVFSKEGLEPIVRLLNSQNVTLYSRRNRRFQKNLGIPVIPGRRYFIPIILGGRVKTLHPKVFEEY
jgi:phosphoribosylaminoimidazolecarboxamide formyltransferase/IMP cyclohydrolase